jgi:hypothetical protein
MSAGSGHQGATKTQTEQGGPASWRFHRSAVESVPDGPTAALKMDGGWMQAVTERRWFPRGRQRRKSEAQEILARACAWCKCEVPRDSEVFAVTARAREGVDLSDLAQEGPFLVLALHQSGVKVHAVVTTDDSEARQSGTDLVFMVCSQDCGNALRQALARELYMAEFLGAGRG